MFRLRKGKAVFSAFTDETALLSFYERILSEQIPVQPFSTLLVRYFREFLLPAGRSAKGIRTGFSFWDNDADNQNARLVAADGFDFRSAGYIKLLRYNEGIAGSLLARYANESFKDAYVSCDLEHDQYLASAQAVREEFGFRSCIALPVSINQKLVGIFKIYLSVLLDTSVCANQTRLEIEAERLSFLLSLADVHFSSSLRKRFAERFQHVDVMLTRSGQTNHIQLVKGIVRTCLVEILQLVGARRGTISLTGDMFAVVGASDDITENQVTDYVRLDLTRFDDPKKTKIGFLEVRDKQDGNYFSLLDRHLLQGVAQTISKYLSVYIALSDETVISHRKLQRQEHLLEISQEISLNLVNATTTDAVIKALLEGISGGFHFSSLVYVLAEKGKLRPYMSVPDSVAATLGEKDFFLKFPPICVLANKRDWTITDCPPCGVCRGLTTVSALRRLPLQVSDITASPFQELYVNFGVSARSEFILPIIAHDTLYGILDMYRKEAGNLEETEEFFLKSICNVAALAFYSQRLFSHLANIEANENRGEMAREVVHTLTPTTASLITYSSLLQENLNSVKQKTGDKFMVRKGVDQSLVHLDRLSDSIRQQQNLIHRYISMSRTSEGTPGEVSLDKIIDDVTNINSYKASNKRVTFKRNLEGKRRAVHAVEMDLYLILWNLINNAVKFSRGNKPSTITITERYRSDDVVVSVRDEGVGIKDEDKPQIWDLGFSTIAPDEKRETSGIGLAAVKELVRVIEGGNINVKSKVNAGAEFILTIAQPG